MRKRLIQHSDAIAIIIILVVFILGGGIIFQLWSVSNQEWQTDFENNNIVLNDVVDSGMGRDSITPIDQPIFETVERAQSWLAPTAPIIALIHEGGIRAYPLSVLLRHEIVNDRIGSQHIAVTFCPLCNSAVIYDREVDGRVLRMGVTGNLYMNNFIMWDNLTESWWQQISGEAIAGAYAGTALQIIPSQVVGFNTFAERYPHGLVLAGDAHQANINYSIYPFMGYDSSEGPLMSDGQHDPRLPAMERVLAGLVNDVPLAYPFTLLQAAGVVHDVIDGKPLVAFWQPGAVSALDGATAETSHDVGQAALFNPVLDGENLTFRYESGHIYDIGTGSEWNIFGEAISGPMQGAQLERYLCFSHFWFAWSATYPETRLYRE